MFSLHCFTFPTASHFDSCTSCFSFPHLALPAPFLSYISSPVVRPCVVSFIKLACTQNRTWNLHVSLSMQLFWVIKHKLDRKMCGPSLQLWLYMLDLEMEKTETNGEKGNWSYTILWLSIITNKQITNFTQRLTCFLVWYIFALRAITMRIFQIRKKWSLR